MVDQGKKNILGVLVDAIDYEGAVMRIVAAAEERRAMTVSALAVHGVMTGFKDPYHCSRLNQFDLLVPDGQPVRWAVNLLYGAGLVDRVYGPTLMLKVCEEASSRSLPIYLYGSRPEVLQSLQEKLRAAFPGLTIAGCQPSRFRRLSIQEKADVVNQIRESEAAITFVGLGCPRQEVWVYEYAADLSMPLLAVGAAFDFHAGMLPQAPEAMQGAGLEWLFRLMHEPRRLWKRYVFLNPAYLALLCAQYLKLKRFGSTELTGQIREMRYG